ncbi:hypothetical protein [Romboutsia sp.]|uniref:hypothetical protein n=1 Tax=Romboutsia sp. TaxID=1965302 RepID=UPI003F2FB5FD
MESNNILENINNKTLPDKLIIVDDFKSKIIDYIESELIFQDEKTLVEDLEQIGLTFIEYKKYSENLSKIIGYSNKSKINSLNDYIEFLNNINEIPSFLDGIDIIEETIEKHNLKEINKILELEITIKNQDDFAKLISSLHNCKNILNENYDKVVSYVIEQYISKSATKIKAQEIKQVQSEKIVKLEEQKEYTEKKTNIVEESDENILEQSEIDILDQLEKIFDKSSTKKEEPVEVKVKAQAKIEPKKEQNNDCILDIFKELIEEELNQKENDKELINNLYEKYRIKKGTLLEGEIKKIDASYLYLKQVDENNEEELIIKIKKLPLHNYRVGAKQNGYIAEITKNKDSVEILLMSSLQSIAAMEPKEPKKATKARTTKAKKAEDTGVYSEKYFKTLFNKIKSELGITMCNVKKCTYDAHFGALVIIDNKKNKSIEEIKFVESLMNKKCGEDIVKIIEFKYNAIEFLTEVFEVEEWDVIKGTGKYVVVNYDTNKMAWYKYVVEQISSMVNYKIEF